MTMLQHGLVPSTGGYQIERSLRFNSADSAYLSRTPGSASNQKTWTYSVWVKRSSFTAATYFNIFTARTTSGSPYLYTYFYNDKLTFESSTSGTLVTTQVFRDPSAWGHIVFSVDTTQATASNRVKIYYNGVQITAFSTETYPTQNQDLAVNSTVNHWIGASPGGEYFNGYMADAHLIDGSALTPSSFGENDTDTGVWKPKAYTGSYGTNGFKLTFSDNSGTTSTTLGKDTSGNGNNWTPNNFSVTAGAGNDSLVDTPTPYGTDTGAGGQVRGNYCTFNPINTFTVANLVNGNLSVTAPGSSYFITNGTIAVSSGKWYWEATVNTASSTNLSIGFSSLFGYDFPGTAATDYGVGYVCNGNKSVLGSTTSYGASYTANDVIGVAIDLDSATKTITFYKNNSSQGSVTLTGGSVFVPSVGAYSTSYMDANFGQRPFAYTAPSGFKALCTTNLPTPTIGATSSTRAGKYFNTVLWTGNGSNPRSITGVGFQPDFSWLARRDVGYGNFLYDAVRGATKVLKSESTGAEYTYQQLNSFDSDGFTQAGSIDAANNTNGGTFVAWNWKANGAGVTNTAGTITSTVSANTTAGFSIVTYTGNGTNGATVGHGLGVAPSMIIIKGRSTAYDWIIYHSGIGNTKFLDFTTAAASTNSVAWNNTSPSSTVFTLGTAARSNENNATQVAYCFAPVAGYSAFGSYTGNGSADGPMVFTGFKPAYVMIKQSSASGEHWTILDNKRNTYNVINKELYANLSNAEGSNAGNATLDFLSNGFKIRTSNAGQNANGATYIYAAFASDPFKYSLAA